MYNLLPIIDALENDKECCNALRNVTKLLHERMGQFVKTE